MNLQPVTGKPFTCVCIRCGHRITAGDVERKAFADLEGKAFVDYYCADCAEKLPKLPVITAVVAGGPNAGDSHQS